MIVIKVGDRLKCYGLLLVSALSLSVIRLYILTVRVSLKPKKLLITDLTKNVASGQQMSRSGEPD